MNAHVVGAVLILVACFGIPVLAAILDERKGNREARAAEQRALSAWWKDA